MGVLCHKCKGNNVLVYMTPQTAICPDCCPNHEYRYEGRGDGHMCEHCGDSPPDDWYYSDDDVSIFRGALSSGAPIGVPMSSLNGNASERDTDPAGWENWIAFCERNGLP